MRGFAVRKEPRLGTAKLLQLTKGMPEDQQRELLGYVGRLEQSEDRLANHIRYFFAATCDIRADD